MTSFVALLVVLSVVGWIAGAQLGRTAARLKALWAWRNGRERAAMCGVIRC